MKINNVIVPLRFQFFSDEKTAEIDISHESYQRFHIMHK